MKLSEYFFPQLFDTSEADILSTKLLNKAGFVKKIASGIYSFMPFATRILNKIIKITKHHLDNIPAQEVILPSLHPKSIWDLTGRWDLYGDDMFKLKDRKGSDLALGPTHEEIITWIVKHHVKSYKQLPVILYQIQPKFRDEPRPRFGLIRAREFLMKDAYSFHAQEDCLKKTYEKFYDAYCKIFKDCGLEYIVVEAEVGLIGGRRSHEFMVASNAGEDYIVICEACGYKANREIAKVGEFTNSQDEVEEDLQLCYTPDKSKAEDVATFLGVDKSRLLKTLIYQAPDEIFACLIPADGQLNEKKLFNLIKKEAKLASAEIIENITKSPVGFSGPIGLSIKKIADNSVKARRNFVVGANKKDYHYKNANLGRDFEVDIFGDLRLADDKNPCPVCNKPLKLQRCIEIGHIFDLGTEYSEKMQAYFTTASGEKKPYIMGCYGIGISRLISALIEVNSDEFGMVWKPNIAPFEIIILVLDVSQKQQLEFGFKIYQLLKDLGFDVLIDDRDESAGKKFFDADLIGIPIQIIISKKTTEQKIEICIRKGKRRIFVSLQELGNFCKEYLS